jgi:hypothetical protein
VSVVASDTAVAFVPDSDLNERIVANWRIGQYRQLDEFAFRFMVARGSSHLVMLERPARGTQIGAGAAARDQPDVSRL